MPYMQLLCVSSNADDTKLKLKRPSVKRVDCSRRIVTVLLNSCFKVRTWASAVSCCMVTPEELHMADMDGGHPGHDDEREEDDEEHTEQDEGEGTTDAFESGVNYDDDDDDDDLDDSSMSPAENGQAMTKQEGSDMKDEGEEEGTSQDEEITEEEPPTDTPSAPSATPSHTSSTATTEPHPQYSTRGRHHSRETDIDALREKVPEEEEVERPVGASFLDSLGEEERRTRTRFLPHVDGFHALFKAEVKHDLQLARTHMSSAGISSKLVTIKPQNKNRRDDEDTEMPADDDVVGPSDDEPASADAPVSGNSTLQDQTVMPPSRAFVVPPDEEYGNSPHVVETVTAFNPPRPPESVGPKKKHRMMRWERQPQDVDIDLNSYRKTVTRTRQELIDAQAERERMESVSAHLRAHFLTQLRALEQEGDLLNREFCAVQRNCIKAADLLQSRTRSRGVGKGSYVMKDVLHILKQKGADIAGFNERDASVTEEDVTVGIGGIPAKAFADWQRGFKIGKSKPASAWILPGQTVTTQYGKGEVLHVFGPVELNVAETPIAGIGISTQPPMPAQHGFGSAEKIEIGANGDSKAGAGMKGADPKNSTAKNALITKRMIDTLPSPPASIDALLAARVCVKLPFGVGFFPLDSISAKEDVAAFSDTMLASRWKNMTETALSVAGCIDLATMSDFGVPIRNEETKMDVDESASDDSVKERESKGVTNDAHGVATFLPFGSGMLPTSAGRATCLANVPILALEQGLQAGLFENCEVLGKIDNTGVPTKFREWEDIRDELSLLRAQVLQRRNELARQRRLRVMNERALLTTADKSVRVENLVAEMREDLKSLKERLDYELIELGIDGEQAGSLLSAHYSEADSKSDFDSRNEMENSPPQRKRREMDRAPSSYKSTRRRADGLSTDEDLDETRSNTKRIRHGQ